MSDLERADRELAALGAVPAALSELVKRYGDADRSLARADAVLAELGNGGDAGPAAPLEPRPSFLPLGWVDQTANGSQAPLPALEAREEITVTSGLPAMDSEPPAAVETPAPLAAVADEPASAEQPSGAVSEPAPATEAEAARQASEPPVPEAEPEAEEPRLSIPLPESLAPVKAATIDPASMRPGTVSSETYAPRSSRPPRPDLQRLLDEELDPREFPSSRPPPPNAGAPAMTPIPSLPPVPRVSQAPSEPAPESDFELLVDDDDIIEIDEDES